MSTRSFIATVTDGGLLGIYHHWDGYPSALADTLLRLHRNSDGDLDGMRRVLLAEHPAGFSTINSAQTLADFETAGFTEYSSRTAGAEKRAVECYCHGDRTEAAQVITCRCAVEDASDCDPLFLEWGYVLNVAGLDVYKSVQTAGTTTVEGARGSYERPNFLHVRVGTLPWDADTAAVEAIEERGYEIGEAAYNAHGEPVEIQ